MTDEEMAEEYFKSVCKDYNEEKERTGERHYWVGFDLKYAYLAGLKAGRPEWHKVADGDLPKDENKASTLNLSDKEMHQLWRALLFYWENKDFDDDNELKEQINMLREKMSDFMIGGCV